MRDHAIFVDGYASAEPFFSTNLRGQRMRAMKLHWKPEWLKRPVFRKSMTYSTYCSYIDRRGKDTGFEDKLTSYCFRQGTANAIDGMFLV